MLALFPGQGKELESILESAPLADFRYDPEVLIGLSIAELNPHLAVFREFTRQDRSESAFADRRTATKNSVRTIGFRRDPDPNVNFSA